MRLHPAHTPPRFHSTEDIVVAATRWLMARHDSHPDPRLAALVRRHLGWLAERPLLTAIRADLIAAWPGDRVPPAH